MIVIDTHVWIWWLDGSSRLRQEHREQLDAFAPGDVGLCDISIWEVATKAQRKTLGLSLPVRQWLESALAPRQVRVLSISAPIAVASAELPDSVTRDPADRLILATAVALNVPLLTYDDRLRAYDGVQHVTASS